MMNIVRIAAVSLLLLWSSPIASAEETWSPEQRGVVAAIEALSAATAPGGTGAESYAAVLADDFSRWTTGSNVVNRKQAWVEGVRDWFEDGWRVAARDQEILEISILGKFAFTRRVVEETYRGPAGESSTSKAGLAETWIRDKDAWLLLQVNAVVLNQP